MITISEQFRYRTDPAWIWYLRKVFDSFFRLWSRPISVPGVFIRTTSLTSMVNVERRRMSHLWPQLERNRDVIPLSQHLVSMVRAGPFQEVQSWFMTAADGGSTKMVALNPVSVFWKHLLELNLFVFHQSTTAVVGLVCCFCWMCCLVNPHIPLYSFQKIWKKTRSKKQSTNKERG